MIKISRATEEWEPHETSDLCPVDLERISAINRTSVALGVETETFNFELRISVRATAHCEIEAIDFEQAKQLCAAAAREGNAVHFALEHCGTFEMDDDHVDSEGDEIGYLDVPGDWDGNGAYPDPIEFDFREPGEPYAWDAAKIVKDLANLDPEGCSMDELKTIVQRAKDALKKETTSDSSERGADTITADRDPDRLAVDDKDAAA